MYEKYSPLTLDSPLGVRPIVGRGGAMGKGDMGGDAVGISPPNTKDPMGVCAPV